MEKTSQNTQQRSTTPGKSKDKFLRVQVFSQKTRNDLRESLNYDAILSNSPSLLEESLKNGVLDEKVAAIKNLDYDVVFYLNETKSLISLSIKHSTGAKYGWNYVKGERNWVPCSYMATTSFNDVKLSEKTSTMITSTLLDLYTSTNQGQRDVLSANGLC